MAPSPPLVGTLARLFARLQQGALFNYQLRCKQYAFKPRTGREVYALASNEPAVDPAVDQRLGDLNAVGLDLSLGPDRQPLPRGQPLAAQGPFCPYWPTSHPQGIEQGIAKRAVLANRVVQTRSPCLAALAGKGQRLPLEHVVPLLDEQVAEIAVLGR